MKTTETHHEEGNGLPEIIQSALITAGIAQLRPKHCKTLSDLIFEATGKRVSVTTLKRVYGFAHREYNISRYTTGAVTEFIKAGQLKKQVEHIWT